MLRFFTFDLLRHVKREPYRDFSIFPNGSGQWPEKISESPAILEFEKMQGVKNTKFAAGNQN